MKWNLRKALGARCGRRLSRRSLNGSDQPLDELFPVVSIVYGFPIMIHLSGFLNMGSTFNIWGTLLIALLLSPIVGFIGISFTSIIVYWAGKLLKGRGRYQRASLRGGLVKCAQRRHLRGMGAAGFPHRGCTFHHGVLCRRDDPPCYNDASVWLTGNCGRLGFLSSSSSALAWCRSFRSATIVNVCNSHLWWLSCL